MHPIGLHSRFAAVGAMGLHHTFEAGSLAHTLLHIEGDAIVVTVPATRQGPVTVSYAWKNWPEANVADATGMPLTAFRTPAQP